MVTVRSAAILAILLTSTADAQSRAQDVKSSSTSPDVRKLLGRKREARVLEQKIIITDPTPLVLSQVVDEIGGGPAGHCQVLLYYDPQTAPPDKVASLQAALDVPLILVDVSRLAFPLLTKRRRRVPLMELLSHRADNRCRILMVWSSPIYQRGLLLMAHFEPGVIRPQDTLVFLVSDQRLDHFMPQLRQRVFIRKKQPKWRGRGRRDIGFPEFQVEKVCEVCPKYSIHQLGEWQYPAGWSWAGAQSLSRSGLLGMTFTVSYTPSVPNIFPVTEGDEQRLEGVELRLLQYAASALNFSYRLIMPEDGEWGRPVNGSWTGKVGQVLKKHADLAVGGLVYTKERADVVQYSDLFHNELWGVVCPLPVRLPVWPYVMFPFRTEVASSVFSLMVVLHVIAFLLSTLVGKHERHEPPNPLAESLTRVTRSGVSLYLRFMACLYFWNLFFCLMKPTYEPPVNTASDLLFSGKRWGVVTGTTVTTVLSESKNSVYQDLVIESIPLSSIGEGFQRLREEGLCLVGVPKRYASATIATRHTTKCGEAGLQISTENLNSVLGGWVVSRGSPLTPYLDKIIHRLKHYGLLERWRKELHTLLVTHGPRELPCLNPPLSGLSLSDLRLAFFMLLGGWGFAIFVFLCEIVVVRMVRDQHWKRQVVRQNTPINLDQPPPNPPSSPTNNVRRLIATFMNAVPSINICSMDADFRRQLSVVLREMYAVRTA
ncbi:glutamate receptor ionotropic, kainate 5-like [Scylla paramamosain]|uniref:glutamate receptor ionotropic, kainate 5-like n=1 Tax=Scylla paramamosain TaxID=85552 RepID=UPI003082DA07